VGRTPPNITKANNLNQAQKKAIRYAEKQRKADGWSKRDGEITRISLVGDLDF